MPVKTCLSSILATRFDFGVPLEDVFPPNDIHPRLKYLFGKAFESYIHRGCDIEIILRQEQGPLRERLKLKEKLVLDLDYHINIEEFSNGAYFWVIRHFLGLLPLPLLPKYTKGIQFDWYHLAVECKNHGKDKHALDYEIALTVNMLPFEHFMLLNLFIAFVRKLSSKTIRDRPVFNRKSMLVLIKYYCSSIFFRPYRPGSCIKGETHFPLLLYLVLRWQKISKHCEAIGHPAHFLECDFKNIEFYKSFEQRDNCTQTNIFGNAFFDPDVISVCRNIPYFINICKNYFKDTGCQTDTDDMDINVSFCPIPEEAENSDTNLTDNNDLKKYDNNEYILAYIEKEPTNLLIDDCLQGTDNDNTLYQTATDFSIKSGLNEEREDWQNTVKEIMDTVKRVEESYIYDDYETFKKEDFNQIGKNGSRSFLSKISKYGFTYTPSKSSTRKEVRKTSTPTREALESDTSYVKYPDVCEDVNFKVHCEAEYDDQCKTQEAIALKKTDHEKKDIKPKSSLSQKLFQEDSRRSVQADSSKEHLENGNSSKKSNKYILNKIRLSLEFLRTLTPKKGTFKRIGSRVKYHRIRSAKSYTI